MSHLLSSLVESLLLFTMIIRHELVSLCFVVGYFYTSNFKSSLWFRLCLTFSKNTSTLRPSLQWSSGAHSRTSVSDVTNNNKMRKDDLQAAIGFVNLLLPSKIEKKNMLVFITKSYHFSLFFRRWYNTKLYFNLLLMRLLLVPNSILENNCILENGVNTGGKGIHACPSEWTIFPTLKLLLGHFSKDSIGIWL